MLISTQLQNLKIFYLRNIVAKSTLKMIAASLIISFSMSLASLYFLKNHQHRQLMDSVEQLATTVESSAKIAAFTADKVLAAEVAKGLLTNKIVKKIKINSLSQDKQTTTTLAAEPLNFEIKEDKLPYQKNLYSPFNPTEKVGTISMWLSDEEVESQVSSYAKLITLTLFTVLILVAGIMSWVIYQTVTKPIKSISDEIHSANLQSSALINTPNENKYDEIGRLVEDTNLLIGRLKMLVGSEQSLRVKHAAAEQRLQLIFEKNKNGLFIADYQLNLSVWNNALTQILSLNTGTTDVLAQPTNLKLMLREHAATIENLKTKALLNQSTESVLLKLSDDAIGQWVEITIQVLDAQNLQGIITDVSNLKKSEMLALAIAEHDALTGLLNRRGFEFKLIEKINHCQTDNGIGLLLIDLDGFKTINDIEGHHAGDHVLNIVSRRLEKLLRPQDVLARLGGDEFVVIISPLKNVQDGEKVVEKVAEKMIRIIMDPIEFENKSLKVGASIGISTTFNPYQNQTLLLKQADSAMYQAKNAGKGQFFIARDTISS